MVRAASQDAREVRAKRDAPSDELSRARERAATLRIWAAMTLELGRT